MAADGLLGILRAPGDGRARPARLCVADDGDATVTAGGELLAFAPFSLLVISTPRDDAPVHLNFPDGRDFETHDREGVIALQKRSGGPAGRGGLRNIPVRLVLLALAGVILGIALYRDPAFLLRLF